MKNNFYEYQGAVFIQKECVARSFKASTWAPSEVKAKQNIAYQYKRRHDLNPRTPIRLEGTLTRLEKDGRVQI